MWTKVRTLAVVATLALAATAASAGDKKAAAKGPAHARPLDAVARAALALPDLSAEQKQKVKEAIADAEGKLMDLRDEAKGGDASARDGLKAKVRQIVRETAEQVAAELTQEQKAAFRESLKSAREEQKSKRRGDGPTTRPQA